MKSKLLCTLVLVVSSLLLGCAEEEIVDINSAKGAFDRAEYLAKSERFEEAIAYYHQVKNKHPYSKLAVVSELRVADIQFKRERYIESEADYRLFKEFHPSHPKSDYVTYRLGLSYFMQLPSTVDRDLALAKKAILYFDEVIHSYKGSSFVPKAIEYRKKSLKMLAGQEEYIGNFYYIRKKHESAMLRYIELLKKYPNLGFQKRALYRATVSAYRHKDFATARKYFQKLAKAFPESKEKSDAEKELSRGTK